MSEVDALSLQVFASLFASVAEMMGVTLQRAAFSPNITMRRDYSCAVFDAAGRLLAQAAHIPVHLGAMPLAMDAVLERFDLQPGDAVIMNDPYTGGTHLPDVSLVSRVFTPEGEAVGYVMSRAHHADVGGSVPGSMPLATELFQEGLIIPPILIRVGGHLQTNVLDLILRNVRTSEERRGDLAAQFAAQASGEAGLSELAQRYGPETVETHGTALQQLSERAMRSLIAQIPPGAYVFDDVLDGDGIDPGPVRVRCTVSRIPDNTDLTIDFSGTALQCTGGINAPRAVAVAAVLYALRCLQGEDAPVNAGSLAPLHIVTPPGTIVNPHPPASVAAGNVETSQRLVDAVFGALSAALPRRVPAASQGTMNNVAFGGWDPVRARPFAYYETLGGGAGARPDQGGMDGVHDHMSNTLNTPVEVLESEYPIRVRRYALRSDRGGSGRASGGRGVSRTLEFLASTTVSLMSERREHAPYGLFGGMPGALGRNMLVQAEGEQEIGSKSTFLVKPGDAVTVETPGGGGFGELFDSEGP